ncbi:MAG: 3'-5' exonuclease [Acidimicrobiia bacterium]
MGEELRAGERVYGLDIETDTAVNGLDPRVAGVVAVAVSGPRGAKVFSGPERLLLWELDEYLHGLEPGVIVTWNGARFDLPFLSDRAALLAVQIGLRLESDPSLAGTHAPLVGHEWPYRARWHNHVHLDAYRVFRSESDPEVSCSLKSVARAHGLPIVEVDRETIHALDEEELERYVISDAAATRALALHRWATAERYLDHQPVQAS